ALVDRGRGALRVLLAAACGDLNDVGAGRERRCLNRGRRGRRLGGGGRRSNLGGRGSRGLLLAYGGAGGVRIELQRLAGLRLGRSGRRRRNEIGAGLGRRLGGR